MLWRTPMRARMAAVAFVIAISCLWNSSVDAKATVKSERPALQGGATTLIVHSEKTGSDYEVEVTRPFITVALPGQRFGTIYALDGGYGFVGQIGRLLGGVAS